MTQITNQNSIKLNKTKIELIERIRRALDIIQMSLPLKSEEFFNTFNELTDCEINYDIIPKVERVEKLNENIEFRIYHVNDKVYCGEKEFTVKAKVIDVFDSYKTIAIVFRYDITDITGDCNE